MPASIRICTAGFIAVCLLVVVGCTQRSESPPKQSVDFGAHTKMLESIRTIDQMAVLYEGLPHQAVESSLWESERQQKDTFELHGYSFYLDRLSLLTEENETLTELLGSASSYKRWLGEKLCDGFHPDYGVEWNVDGVQVQILICFGCHEVKMYFGRSEVRCDLRDDVYLAIRDFLVKHRKNRPPSGELGPVSMR